MGLKIADLLKFRGKVELKNPRTDEPILGPDKKQVIVYLRLIGDDDLEKAHKAARLASANLRKVLKDKDGEVYKDRVGPILDGTKDDWLSIIKSSRTSNVDAEARVAIERPDLPGIEEFAVTPDAPTLEEQEKMDEAVQKIEDDYRAAISEYVDIKTAEIMAEFEDADEDKLRETAAEELINVLALGEFFSELMDYKVAYGSYTDPAYKNRAFDNVEEFKGAHSSIKEQLISGYIKLELDPDQVKN